MDLAADLLLDLDAVVKRSNVSRRTWRREIAAGRIGVVRIAGSVRVPNSELEKYLSARYTPAREIRRAGPQSIEEILDRVVPRRRGRPKIGEAG
jgi:excisionase family DNA binding protein